MFKPAFPTFLSAVVCAAAMIGVAHAAPQNDAQAHVRALENGDVSALMSHYAPDARLYWIGGPLDGDYANADAIGEVWTKFIRAQGGGGKATLENWHTSVNPKGATVTASLLFDGQTAVKVFYVLSYRNDKIVSEIWQVDPALNIATTP